MSEAEMPGDDFIMPVEDKVEYIEDGAIEPNLDSNEFTAKRNIIAGDFNEYLCSKTFKKFGYTVVKLVHQNVHNGDFYLDKKAVEFVCLHYNKYALMNALRNMPVAGIPDFLVLKNDDCFFVECKARVEGVRPKQEDVHRLLTQMGFEVKLWTLPIKIDIKYGEGKMFSATLTPSA